MNRTLAILVSVVLTVAGQLLVKHGINLLVDLDFSRGLVQGFLRVFSSPIVLAGTAVYAISVLVWLYALSSVDLSFAYPLGSVSYVLIVLASWLMLGESIAPVRWVGIGLICFGVGLVLFS